MTEREKELLGYIGELLSLSRRETRWRGPREVWERIEVETRTDRRKLRVERPSVDGLTTISTRAA